MKKCIALLGFVFLLGWEGEYNDPKIVSENKQMIAGGGEVVGTLPDGREVRRIRLNMGSNLHDHWIYVVSGTETVTMNHEVSEGKTTTGESEVFINGVKYTKAPASEQQALKGLAN